MCLTLVTFFVLCSLQHCKQQPCLTNRLPPLFTHETFMINFSFLEEKKKANSIQNMNNNLDEVLEDSFFLQMHNIQIFRKEQYISLSADLTQTLGAPQMCPCMLIGGGLPEMGLVTLKEHWRKWPVTRRSVNDYVCLVVHILIRRELGWRRGGSGDALLLSTMPWRNVVVRCGSASQVTAVGQEVMAVSCNRGGLIWILGILIGKSGDALAQAAQGWGGALSLEVSKNCGDVALRDTVSEHRGVGLGELRGISTVNDSMTLWFSDSIHHNLEGLLEIWPMATLLFNQTETVCLPSLRILWKPSESHPVFSNVVSNFLGWNTYCGNRHW